MAAITGTVQDYLDDGVAFFHLEDKVLRFNLAAGTWSGYWLEYSEEQGDWVDGVAIPPGDALKMARLARLVVVAPA